MHAEAPDTSEYEPDAHDGHDDAPPAVAVPTGHDVATPPWHMEPAGHGEHAAAPLCVEN